MRRKASFTSLGLGLAAIFVAFGSPHAMASEAASDCDLLLKASVSDPHQISGITGSATLCIDHGQATVSEWAENLLPGHVYTTWFAYIDDPTKCGNYPGGTPGVCADPDAVLPAGSPTAVFSRMNGAIAGERGRLHMTGDFRDLRFSKGSAVWIIMFEHGPAGGPPGTPEVNRYLARQLLTPQLPVLGAPGLGAPADGDVGHGVALAAFKIP
jgi:hypothetical protein